MPRPAPTATVAVAVASVRPVDPAGLEAVGSAPPGSHVRLRLNNSLLAEVIAGADGEWRLTIERGLTAGDYVLEAAVVDAAGAILARAEAPFVYPQREAVASVAPRCARRGPVARGVAAGRGVAASLARRRWTAASRPGLRRVDASRFDARRVDASCGGRAVFAADAGGFVRRSQPTAALRRRRASPPSRRRPLRPPPS